MTPKQRDILLIPIPFTDLSSQKRRPVIVLSNSKHNEAYDDFVAVAVASNIQEKEYSLWLSQGNLEEGHLKVPSMVRADKIYTLS